MMDRAASVIVALFIGSAGCATIGGGAAASEDAGVYPDGGPDSAAPPVPPTYTCEAFGGAGATGVVETAAVTEASGLVASRTNEGVLWTANDSANGEELYALSREGKLLGTFTLQGAFNVDWEDLAIGPSRDGAGDLLYVGDIGDNDLIRPEIVVYRIREPIVPRGPAPVESVVPGVERIALVYPGGARYNAETLFVDQASGELVILTREFGTARIFRAREELLVANATVALEEAGAVPLTVPNDAARGGSAADTGEAAALRTTYGLYLFTFGKGIPLVDALKTPLCKLPLGPENRGETVAFAPGVSGYYTLAEGTNSTIYFVARQ